MSRLDLDDGGSESPASSEVPPTSSSRSNEIEKVGGKDPKAVANGDVSGVSPSHPDVNRAPVSSNQDPSSTEPGNADDDDDSGGSTSTDLDDFDDDNNDNSDEAVSSPDKASELLVQATSLKEEGNDHFKAGRLDQAARSYRRGCNALKKILNYAGDDQVRAVWIALQANLSTVLCKQGKHKASADVASKVLGRDPHHIKALYRRAVALRHMGNLEGARGDLRTALKIEPNNVACKKELAAVKKELEQSNERQKKALAKAFSNKSSSLLYDDKEAAERKKEEKKRLEKQAQQELYKKRKQEWEDECVKRMAKNEAAVSFEDWEKEQKEEEERKLKEEEIKRKEEERRRKEERKKRREEAKSNPSDSESDDDKLTERELAMMRGYKKTKDGRTTSYFTRELSEEEKRAYDIAPKRLNEVSNTAPTRLASGSEGSGPSAWNLAGTWEEKDTSSWCTDQLRKRLEDSGVTCLAGSALDVNITSVERVEGHASVAMAAGKKRYIFEYEASLKYEIKSENDSLVASGLARLPDICSTHHEELEVSFEPWIQRPDAKLESQAMKARSRFVDEVRLQVQKWVEDFNDQY